MIGHEAYKDVEPTYDSQEELILGRAVPDTSVPESSNPTPEPSPTIPEPDTTPEPPDQLELFTEHFATDTGT